MALTVGTDPEVFFHKDDKFISAVGLIGGSKWEPRETNFGAVQEDNVAGEFNIPPATSAEEMIHSINAVMEELKDIVGLDISQVSAAVFDDVALAHPAAQEAGCDTDYDVWTMRPNPKPNIQGTNLRTAGGHVHVGGVTITTPAQLMFIVKALDLALGVPSVLLDTGEKRKELYGKAGAHRIKDYGVEYRVLSNFWIFDNALIRWVFEQVEWAVNNMDRLGPHIATRTDIQEAINTNDKDLALALVEEFNLNMPE